MSARQRKGAARARPGATGPPRSATPGGTARSGRAPAKRRFLVPLAFAALAGALIYATLAGRRATQSDPDSVLRLDPVVAYQRALHFSTHGEWRAALPYYRRAMEGSPGREWRPHFNYALVLNDLTLQFTTRAGQQVPATRSSAERVRLGSAALDEFWQAIQLAPDGATRAKILALRANMLVLWGFPWEAFATYRAATHADSTREDLRARGDQFLALMQDPSRFRFVQPDSSMRLPLP
jgi:tetratricopeptide (TPR) repeat protein